jgi:hypothetical protein
MTRAQLLAIRKDLDLPEGTGPLFATDKQVLAVHRRIQRIMREAAARRAPPRKKRS